MKYSKSLKESIIQLRFPEILWCCLFVTFIILLQRFIFCIIFGTRLANCPHGIINPINDVRDSCINSGIVSLSASVAPAYNTDELIVLARSDSVVSIGGDQWAA